MSTGGRSLDLPYLAVGRTDGQAAVYLYLAEWDGVDGDLLRGFRFVRVAVNPDFAARQAKPRVLDPRPHVPGRVEVRQGLSLLGGREHLELG